MSASDDGVTRLELRVELQLDRFKLELALETRAPVTGVFGASGSGKTSLLETVAGLRRRARGVVRCGDTVWLDSEAGVFVRPEHRRIGLVPQDGLLFPDRSVRANLLAGAARARAAGRDPAAELGQVVDLLELAGLLESSPVKLSGGERQRVALGRALCSGAELLLFDEPFASLDLPLRRRLLPFLNRVRETYRIPILFVSHDPVEVQALCDEVLLLREGHAIARGTPREILSDPTLYSLAEGESYENVLRGQLVEAAERGGRLRLGQGSEAPTIEIPATTATPGETLFVGLFASEILIATGPPTGLSARNALGARLESVQDGPNGKIVAARFAPDVLPLTVEVTDASYVDLGLAPGRDVVLVFKASSCRPYGHGRRRPGVPA